MRVPGRMNPAAWTNDQSPTTGKRLIFHILQNVFLNFIRLHPDKTAIADFAFQTGMFYRLVYPLLPGSKDDLSSLCVQVNSSTRLFFEVFCLDLELVEQLEDQAIDENGLKYLRNIEIQTETPEIGLMQIPDTRIEVCAIYL